MKKESNTDCLSHGWFIEDDSDEDKDYLRWSHLQQMSYRLEDILNLKPDEFMSFREKEVYNAAGFLQKVLKEYLEELERDFDARIKRKSEEESVYQKEEL